MGEQVIQRARSIAVRPAVTALVIVKRGANAVISEFPSKGAVLQFHPLAAKKLKLRFGGRHSAFLRRQEPVDFGLGHFFYALEKLRLSDLSRPI